MEVKWMDGVREFSACKLIQISNQRTNALPGLVHFTPNAQ